MKTTKFYGIISFFLIAITIISCVEDGEFDVPNITVEEPNIIANSSISAIKSALQQEYNASGDLVAVAKLSQPVAKDFTKEALIRVKLDY